jgi:hypothetical protein
VLTLAAAAGCVAVLVSALVWITVGSPAEPGPGSAPIPVSAPGRPTLADPVAVPTADASAGTAGQPGGAVPAELAATFPDLEDIARTGTSAALSCQPARTANLGGGAGVAQPTYAVMCQVRGVPNAVVVFARFPDRQSGPRNVLASRALYPSVITDSRWNLNGVDQGPIAGVRQGETSRLPVVLQFGFDRIPVIVAVFATDLETAQTAFTGIRLTPERATG